MLALVHVGCYDDIVKAVIAPSVIYHKFGDNASHGSAGIKTAVGHGSHQSYCTAAVDAPPSGLSEQFEGKRFSRQRINEILAGRAEISRFDLITLYFFIFSKRNSEISDSLEKGRVFTEKMNDILNECGMWPLYIANPYEAFVSMCIETEDPMDTYAEVLEMAYSEV